MSITVDLRTDLAPLTAFQWFLKTKSLGCNQIEQSDRLAFLLHACMLTRNRFVHRQAPVLLFEVMFSRTGYFWGCPAAVSLPLLKTMYISRFLSEKKIQRKHKKLEVVVMRESSTEMQRKNLSNLN